MKSAVSYVGVAHNDKILVQCALGNGDFDLTINKILSKAEFSEFKVMFSLSGNTFYLEHEESGLNIIAVYSNDCSSETAFSFLAKVKQKFLTNFPFWDKAEAYSLQSDFEQQLLELTEKESIGKEDKIEEIQMKALNQAILIGEKTEKNDKIQLIHDESDRFDREAFILKSKIFLKKKRMLIFSVINAIILLIIIIIAL